MTAAPAPASAAAELRAAGLRVTAARVALLEVVRDGDHLGAEALATRVRDRIGHISLQAVYDVLRALTEAGLVRRIEPAGCPPRYESRVGDNHHHVVCRSCGDVADVDCAVGDAPCLTAVRRPRLRRSTRPRSSTGACAPPAPPPPVPRT